MVQVYQLTAKPAKHRVDGKCAAYAAAARWVRRVSLVLCVAPSLERDPMDEPNALLEARTNPPNWQKPTPSGRYNPRRGTRCSLVARDAGKMISEISTLMTAGAGLSALAKTVHPYPTQADVFKKAADAHNRQRLAPRARRLSETLLKWRR